MIISSTSSVGDFDAIALQQVRTFGIPDHAFCFQCVIESKKPGVPTLHFLTPFFLDHRIPGKW